MTSRHRRIVSLAAVLWFGLTAGRVGAAGDQWVEVKSEHFSVLSNAGEGKARSMAWQFEQVRSAIRKGFPWAEVELNRPVEVIALKDEDSMRALVPQFWAQRGGTRPGSVFVSGWDRHYIALRADLEVEAQGLNPHNQAFWAYSALVLNTNFHSRLPLWLSNGLASLLSNTIVRDKEIQFGSPIPWLVNTVRTQPLLPLGDLLAVTRDSPYFTQQVTRERFDAQCWSLVQFLMFSDKADMGGRLNRLTRLVLAGTPSAVAVPQVFGSLDALEEAYRLYVHQGAFTFGRLDVDTDTSAARYPSRTVPPAEAAAIRATFDVAMSRPDEARALIAQARKADPHSIEADDAEAMLLDREEKRDEALQAYTKAASEHSTNFWVYYRLASLSSGARIEPGRMADLSTRLDRAVALNPSYGPALSFLANLQASQRHLDQAIDLALRAARSEPGELSHRLLLARLLTAANRPRDAADVAREALPLSATAQERSSLQAFIAAGGAAAPTPGASPRPPA